jgi:hypothetical protein
MIAGTEARLADREVADFLDRLPRTMPYSEMAAACAERFGPERAWSRAEIILYWERRLPRKWGRFSFVNKDPEVAAFLEDRLGRLTVGEARAACLAQFGPDRTPGRSTIHRFWSRLRAARRA